MKIVGAGLAGLLAAHAWPQAEVFEEKPAPSAAHKALLRFRGEEVSKLTGIEFRPVTVRKGIWFAGRFHQPNIRMANWYSAKVTGARVNDRSIWSLDPVQRFIAPEDFYEQLVTTIGRRVRWGEPYAWERKDDRLVDTTVCTAPLPVALNALQAWTHLHGLPKDAVVFRRSGIKVQRFRLPDTDLFQTV